MNTHSKQVSQIHHANNMLPKILINQSAKPLISAKIAHGHHAQPMKHAKINAGLLITNITMPVTITP